MIHQPLWLRDLGAYSLQVAIIVIAGSLLPPLLRVRVPKVRLIYWQVLLGACLLLPLIQPWRVSLLPLNQTGAVAVGEVGVSLGLATAISAGRSLSLAEMVLAVMIAGVMFRILWIALGLRRLRRYYRLAHALEEITPPIREAQRLVSADAAFYLSRELPVPARSVSRLRLCCCRDASSNCPPRSRKPSLATSSCTFEGTIGSPTCWRNSPLPCFGFTPQSGG